MTLRTTRRTLSARGFGMTPDVALGKNASGQTTVLIVGGSSRTAAGLAFNSRGQVEELVQDLTEALADWDEGVA